MTHPSTHYLETMLTHSDAPADQRWKLLAANREFSVTTDNENDAPVDPMAQITKAAVMVALSKNHGDEPAMIGVHWSQVLELQNLSNQYGDQPEIAQVVDMIMNHHVDQNLITTHYYNDNKSSVSDSSADTRKIYNIEENNANFFNQREKAWGSYPG